MKLKKWEYALIFGVLVLLLCGYQGNREQRELSQKLIRLHVVANSDSQLDQSEKLRVRDAVLAYLRPRLQEVEDAGQAREVIRESLPGIVAAAGEITQKPVTAGVGVETFPTVEYDTFSLPAGKYMSLRVIIGEGAGHNWWCVVFPPVCDAPQLTESASAAIGLSPQEIGLMTEDSPKYVVKFRFMELIGKFLALFDA